MILFSIFIASRITTSCPASTLSPGFTSTRMIRPGIGALTTRPVIGSLALADEVSPAFAAVPSGSAATAGLLSS